MDVLLYIFLFESEDQSMKFSLSPPYFLIGVSENSPRHGL